jgi:hypothetical protein
VNLAWWREPAVSELLPSSSIAWRRLDLAVCSVFLRFRASSARTAIQHTAHNIHFTPNTNKCSTSRKFTKHTASNQVETQEKMKKNLFRKMIILN